MAYYRLQKRYDCEDHCQLRLRDSIYSAMIVNISVGGALVHFYDPLPGVHVGENCKMSLKKELTCVYNCEVVRVETSNIALRMIDIDMP
jgi:hypothetical protein